MAPTPSVDEQSIRVLIIDDHRLFAEALASALEVESDIHVVEVASSLTDGVESVGQRSVDVVLLDYRLPDGSGLDAVSTIRQLAPHAAVIMVTASEDEGLLLSAVEAGCAGFVSKTADLGEIHTAVRRAAAGEATIAPLLLARLLGRLAQRGTGLGADLTAREREVLGELGAGRSNAEIAVGLSLSVNTVRNHVQAVLVKLGAHSKLEAVTLAVREGLIDPMRRPAPPVR